MKSIEFKRIKLAVGDSSFEFSITEQLYEAISNQKINGGHYGLHDGIEYFLRHFVEANKRPPSMKQIEYVISIAEKLSLNPKVIVFKSTEAASDFIDEYKELFHKKLEDEKETLARYQASPEYVIFQNVEGELKFHQTKLQTTDKKIYALEMFQDGKTIDHIAQILGVKSSTAEKYLEEAMLAKEEYTDQPLSWLGLHYLFAFIVRLNKESQSVSQTRTDFTEMCIEKKWHLLPWFYHE